MFSNLKISYILMILFFLISGCSLLTSKDKQADSDDQFKKVISHRSNQETTPVEVASEFNQLVVDENVALPTLVDDSKLKNPFKTLRPDRKPANVVPLVESQEDAIIKSENLPIQNLSVGGGAIVKTRGTKAQSSRHVSGQKSIKGKYVVRAGDTLMKISFEKYGDIYQWRNILNDNRDKLINKSVLVPGTELTINGEEYVVIEKNGNPYLIKKNDTLLKISKNVYGTASEWKRIWKNNPQLIKNPNKIYAGFTLYYQNLIQNPSLTDKKSKSSKATADSLNESDAN